VNPAVIGETPGCPKCKGVGEPGIMYCRIKYPVRTIGITGRRAMVITGPGPLDGVADVDRNRPGTEDRSALANRYIRGRRRGEDWNEKGK
jgi:hypothetical protein